MRPALPSNARRWRLELCLRDLKTVMGMDQLRCKTPEMVRKELWTYLLAYNLIRVRMAQAAAVNIPDPSKQYANQNATVIPIPCGPVPAGFGATP